MIKTVLPLFLTMGGFFPPRLNSTTIVMTNIATVSKTPSKILFACDAAIAAFSMVSAVYCALIYSRFSLIF